jgi:hypothetical protein
MTRKALRTFMEAMVGWQVNAVNQDRDGTHVAVTDGTTDKTLTYGKYNKITEYDHRTKKVSHVES